MIMPSSIYMIICHACLATYVRTYLLFQSIMPVYFHDRPSIRAHYRRSVGLSDLMYQPSKQGMLIYIAFLECRNVKNDGMQESWLPRSDAGDTCTGRRLCGVHIPWQGLLVSIHPSGWHIQHPCVSQISVTCCVTSDSI